MIEELRKLEDEGLISLRAHDELPLYIANYTPTVQYDRLWDEHPLLKQCRGLIVDEGGNVVARPFEKFFNYEEHKEFDSLEDIPVGEHCDIYEKLDGSLGIVFFYDGKWRVATRGSFHSEQADKATELLSNYNTEELDTDYTYLVEIIYPSNKIVVDYGSKEELILIAIIRTEDGAEPIQLERYKDDKPNNVFPIVNKLLISDVDRLMKMDSFHDRENFEGYVIHFHSGLRVKVKLDEYVRLHRLLTGLTKRTIWELLRDGEDVDKIYETAPDEVYEWVEETVYELTEEFRKLSLGCKLVFPMIMYEVMKDDSIYDFDGNIDESQKRKVFAKHATDSTLKDAGLTPMLFRMYDRKDIDDLVWKQIKPEAENYAQSS